MTTVRPLTESTRTFARILGPFFAIASITAVARSGEMRDLLADFEATPVLSWVVGAFILLGGIVVVVLHPHWSGFTAAVVSLLGWIMIIRGFVLLAFPDVFAAVAEKTIGAEAFWRTAFAVIAVLGLCLTWVGYAPAARSDRRPDNAASRGPVLPTEGKTAGRTATGE